MNVGAVSSCLGQHEQAIEQLQNAVKLDPAYSYARYELGMAYLRKTNHAEAIDNLQKAVDMRSNDAALDEPVYLAGLAYAYSVAGQENKAMEILRRLEERQAHGESTASQWDGGLYPIYYALGEKRQAFMWLEKAYRERSDALPYLRCWPEFEDARKDSRFSDLFRRVGIPF